MKEMFSQTKKQFHLQKQLVEGKNHSREALSQEESQREPVSLLKTKIKQKYLLS